MQRLTIVRYKVKPEFVAENEQLSHAVFDRVRRDRPEGIDYSLFKEADGQSFVHVFRNQREDDSTSLPSCLSSRRSALPSACVVRSRRRLRD